MTFLVKMVPEVEQQIRKVAKSDQILLKKIRKAFDLLKEDPQYPSLKTQKYQQLSTTEVAVYESYISVSGAAWRAWWRYGPDEEVEVITVLAIGAHPKIKGKLS